MKKVLFLLSFGALVACSGNNESTTQTTDAPAATEQVADGKQYACPMKCEGDKTYAEAGKCPVCEMDLKEVAVAHTEGDGHNHDH